LSVNTREESTAGLEREDFGSQMFALCGCVGSDQAIFFQGCDGRGVPDIQIE
jgi:hypothetical protein